MTTMTKPKFEKVQNLTHLTSLLKEGKNEFFIGLQFGIISRKIIYLKRNTFHIENCIDDTKQRLTEVQLMDRNYTNIGDALTKGSFYYYC